MTKVIVIANKKGGVGKTTTAVTMAALLKEKNFSVLLIDTDSQGNYSLTYKAKINEDYAPERFRKLVTFSPDNFPYLMRISMRFGLHPSEMINAMLDDLRKKYEDPEEFVDADIYGLSEVFEQKIAEKMRKKVKK